MAHSQVQGWCPGHGRLQADTPRLSYPIPYYEPPAYVPSQFQPPGPTPPTSAAQSSQNYDTLSLTRSSMSNLPSSSQASSKPSLACKAPSTIRRFSRKAADDPNYIPRPRNAFIIFRCDYTEKHKLDNAISNKDSHKSGAHVPNLPAKTLSKRAAEAWRALPELAKEEWRIKAKKEAQAHQEAFPEYKFRPMKPNARATGDAHPSQAYEQCWAASTSSHSQHHATPASTCASSAPSRHVSPLPAEIQLSSTVAAADALDDDIADAELLGRRRSSLPQSTAYQQFLLPQDALSRQPVRRSRSLATQSSAPLGAPVRPSIAPHPYGAYSTGSLPLNYTPSRLNYMYQPAPDPTYAFPPNICSSPAQDLSAAYQPATVSPLNIHSAHPPPEPHVSPLAHVATTWNDFTSETSGAAADDELLSSPVSVVRTPAYTEYAQPSVHNVLPSPLQDADLAYLPAETPSDTSSMSLHPRTPSSPQVLPPAYVQAVESSAAPAAKEWLPSPSRSDPAPPYLPQEDGAGLPGYEDASHAHAPYAPEDHGSGYGLDLGPSLYRRSEGAGYNSTGACSGVDLTNYHTGLIESGILPGGGVNAFRAGDPIISGDGNGDGYGEDYRHGDHASVWGPALMDDDFNMQCAQFGAGGQMDIHELIERWDSPIDPAFY